VAKLVFDSSLARVARPADMVAFIRTRLQRYTEEETRVGAGCLKKLIRASEVGPRGLWAADAPLTVFQQTQLESHDSRRAVFMSENPQIDSWLSLGLAFIADIGDGRRLRTCQDFTGHITGTLVLAAISLAGHDWRTLLRHF